MVGRVNKPATPCPKEGCGKERYRTPSGWMRCPDCDAKRSRNYHGRNVEKHKERVIAYYNGNKERWRNYERINKDIIRENSKRWRSENKGRLLEYQRDYKSSNREYVNLRSREWYKNNPDKIKKYSEHKKINRHPLYAVWNGILNRCLNPNSVGFARYGSQGVKVAERWEDFSNFVEDVSPRPSLKHTLDRINTWGNYEPGNVRWATAKEQARNRKNTRYLFIEGNRVSLTEYAEKNNIPYGKALGIYLSGINTDTLIESDGKYITLKELSEKTGIRLEIIILRARLYFNTEYITAINRSMATYKYKKAYYTLIELFVISGISEKLLYNRIINGDLTVEEAMSRPPTKEERELF